MIDFYDEYKGQKQKSNKKVIKYRENYFTKK